MFFVGDVIDNNCASCSAKDSLDDLLSVVIDTTPVQPSPSPLSPSPLSPSPLPPSLDGDGSGFYDVASGTTPWSWQMVTCKQDGSSCAGTLLHRHLRRVIPRLLYPALTVVAHRPQWAVSVRSRKDQVAHPPFTHELVRSSATGLGIRTT